MKRLFLFTLLVVMSAMSSSAFAAKTIRVTVNGWFGNYLMDPAECSFIETVPGLSAFAPISCIGLDAAIRGGGSFSVIDKNGESRLGGVSVTGTCNAGADAGQADIPVSYTKEGNIDIVLQPIRDPMASSGARRGCKIAYRL